MSYQTSSSWFPYKNSNCISILIALTAIATLCCVALEPLFTNVFNISGPLEFFGLSRSGLANFFLWQPLTCIFIQPEYGGIHLYFLVTLTISLYLLWMFGSDVAEHQGSFSFVCLYLFTGVLSSLITLFLTTNFWQNQLVAGPSPAILATFVSWTLLHKQTMLFLFSFFPIRAKTLLVSVATLSLLIPISSLDYKTFVYHLCGLTIGYLWSLLVWELRSDFSFLKSFENKLLSVRNSTTRYFYSKFGKQKSGKIFDFHTGKVYQNDEAFMDAMLTKISKEGEKSLSRYEIERMRAISEKKMKK